MTRNSVQHFGVSAETRLIHAITGLYSPILHGTSQSGNLSQQFLIGEALFCPRYRRIINQGILITPTILDVNI